MSTHSVATTITTSYMQHCSKAMMHIIIILGVYLCIVCLVLAMVHVHADME